MPHKKGSINKAANPTPALTNNRFMKKAKKGKNRRARHNSKQTHGVVILLIKHTQKNLNNKQIDSTDPHERNKNNAQQ